MKRHLFIFFLVAVMPLTVFSQRNSDKSLVNKYMNIAKEQMQKEDYGAANLTFRKILSTKGVIPNNLTYLFAETLFMINQYENSSNFLKKYIKLTGKSGDYYKESIQLQDLLDGKLNEIKTCDYCDVRGYRMKSCTTCNQTGTVSEICYYCKGKGVVHCLTCQGLGVVISESILGEKEYKGCPKCSGHGHHTCDTCAGKKTLENQCPTCLGSLHESTEQICDHNDKFNWQN